MRPYLALLVAALVIGCGSQAATPVSTSGPSSGTSPSIVPVPPAASVVASAAPPSATVDATAIAAARQMIEAAVLVDDRTLDEIGGTIRFTAAGEQAAREVLESASGTDVLWAAIWVYASSGSDPAPLRPALDNPDPSIRVMAAACLTALGDPSGFAALRESLVDENQLLGSRPPRSIRAYALETLLRYVPAEGAPSPPATDDDVADAVTRWADWLGQHQNELRFDEATGTWALR